MKITDPDAWTGHLLKLRRRHATHWRAHLSIELTVFRRLTNKHQEEQRQLWQTPFDAVAYADLIHQQADELNRWKAMLAARRQTIRDKHTQTELHSL